MRFVDLTGERFGRLVVVGKAPKSRTGKTMWRCRCDCGNTAIVFGSNLRHGATQSCGCYRQEIITKHRYKHGMTDTPLYLLWQFIKEKCYTPSYAAYKYYGGKGVVMCSEWKDNFMAFHDWAMSKGYREGMSIRLIDKSKDFEPGNCYFITRG